jgi:hypothetical protein
MAENCRQTRPSIGSTTSTDQQLEENTVPYKEPSKDSSFYGLESHFNEDVVFYKDVRIHGELLSNVSNFRNKSITTKNLNVLQTAIFDGYSYFSDNVYLDKGISAGIATIRDKLDVGCGATTLTADASTGKVGIGSTTPQQKLDVAGSVKIDETIYDSANVPGKNGYYMVRDDRGLRWIPLVAESVSGVPGIGTDGIFVLDEGVPLYPA